MIKIIKVTGASLSPFFLHGDYVLTVANPKRWFRLKPGDVVVFDHPDHGTMIKFVKENKVDTSTLFVIGTNPNSISSHKLGPIPYSSLIGKVIFPIMQK